MNKRTLTDPALQQAQQHLLEKLASMRFPDAAKQAVEIDRFLAVPEVIKPTHTPIHVPAGLPLNTTPTAQAIAPSEVSKGAYLKRRLSLIFQPGISLKARLRAIPVFGYAMSVVLQGLRLPLTRQQHEERLQSSEDAVNVLRAQVAHLNQRIDELVSKSLHGTQIADENFGLLDRRLQQQEAINVAARLKPLEMLDVGQRLMKLEQIEAERKLRQFSNLLQQNERENLRLRGQVSELTHQLYALSPAGQQALPLVASHINTNGVDKSQVDEFFKEFEDKFRGSKDEIKQRLSVYLPYLAAAKVDQLSQVVDVGCGRGEWLELLAENRIPALGVDLNLAKVEACIADGLAAKATDAIQFLREQTAGSIAAVTGFHIIEHLPFETMLALFDAAHQALRPGGILIFETPNPENILVGACNFYYDPTHLQPIVPAVAQFIAQQRGFVDVEILPLHPYPEDHHTTGDTDADTAINRYFFGPQDYAVIARK